MTSNKGNVISKNGTEEDPAVVIERFGVSLSTPESVLASVGFGLMRAEQCREKGS